MVGQSSRATSWWYHKSVPVPLQVAVREAGATSVTYGCLSQWNLIPDARNTMSSLVKLSIHYVEMDPVRESQGSFNNLLIDKVNYSDDAY